MAEIELPNPEELNEHRRDRFARRVALLTAIFAVVLAISSLGGNNAAKEMMLSQQQSSNQWAFYQSKVMREHLYKAQRLQVELQLAERQGAMSPAIRAKYGELAKQFGGEEQRYREEKKGIEGEAKKQEELRDKSMAKDPYFDYAEVLLQIAIVLASIAILSQSRPVVWLALGSAIIGSVLCLNGYLLLFRIPFFH